MSYFDAHENIEAEKRNSFNDLTMCVIKNTQAENLNDFKHLATTHTSPPIGGTHLCTPRGDLGQKIHD